MIGTRIANYQIEEQLGEGGMGVVYKAVDVNLDRTVALKFLSPELNRDPSLIARFQSEAKAQANLNHTNIATLYNFLNVDGNWLIVMEYVEGENLEQLIIKNGVIQWQDAVPLFKQALLGIGFAHRFGIVHRDIKPSNIMINRHGIVKVMDFGIAKALSGRKLTRTGVAVGTVSYMSPEQVRNQGVDNRSDIYSLGVTLYQMLTAHLPFDSESDFQVQFDHINTPPPPLSLYHPYIPPGIEAAVLKAMEKDPANRFRTVEEFGAVLERPHTAPAATPAGEPAAVVLPPTVVSSAVASQTPPPKPPVVASPAAAATPTPAPSLQPTAAPPTGQTPAGSGTAAQPGGLSKRNLMIAGAAAVIFATVIGIVLLRRPHENEKPVSGGGASGGGAVISSSPSTSPQPSVSQAQPSGTLEVPPPEVATAPKKTEPNPQQKPQEQPKEKEKKGEGPDKKTPPPPPPAAPDPLQKAQEYYVSQRLLSPPYDCALSWAKKATEMKNPQGPAMEKRIQQEVHGQFAESLQSKNYSQASSLLSQIEGFYPPGTFQSWRSELDTATAKPAPAPPPPTVTKEPTPTVASSGSGSHSFKAEHRHIEKIGSIFTKRTGEPTEWYYQGTLTIDSAGMITFRCQSVSVPHQACEADIEIAPGDIRKLDVSNRVHIGTTKGNYDFVADGHAMTEIRNLIQQGMQQKQ